MYLITDVTIIDFAKNFQLYRPKRLTKVRLQGNMLQKIHITPDTCYTFLYAYTRCMHNYKYNNTTCMHTTCVNVLLYKQRCKREIHETFFESRKSAMLERTANCKTTISIDVSSKLHIDTRDCMGQ